MSFSRCCTIVRNTLLVRQYIFISQRVVCVCITHFGSFLIPYFCNIVIACIICSVSHFKIIAVRLSISMYTQKQNKDHLCYSTHQLGIYKDKDTLTGIGK